MPSTVTPVIIQKEFVLCAVSKYLKRYLTPSFINKAMYSSTQMLSGSSGQSVMTDRLDAASRFTFPRLLSLLMYNWSCKYH
ncbi:hypothetical protein OIU84_002293 [Salix udensis]|uniref:Uncharacterized protein n=1 Tax=Salix udensis TaxID=889485 RepID=A0AAD6K3T4_9ROSI|nr:hypothetical protein OIU84_002293 [Salix udensis]